MKRLLLCLLLYWPLAAVAQTACLQSPTGTWTCGGAVIVTDNNGLPTPAPNVLTVTANNCPTCVMPTPVAGTCKLFDMAATGTDTCVATNGTAIMHIPPLGSELPRIAISTQTGTPYTVGATADEVVLCDATAQSNVINLPAAATAGAGRRYIIKKTDSTGHTCTVTPNGSEKIDGAATQVITSQYTGIPLVTDGSNWFLY